MITEDYVTFEIAKLLKEKGFNERTQTSYIIDNTDRPFVKVGDFVYSANTESHRIAAPTHQMAMKWLREKHGLFIGIDYDYYEDYDYVSDIPYYASCVYFVNEREENGCAKREVIENLCKTYEEAVEAALEYCLTKLI